MRIAVIHGQQHKGSTYCLTHMLLERLEDRDTIVQEFYVNGITPCVGCFRCIVQDEKLCPAREKTEPIIEAIEQCDILLVESPNYCMGMTGQLKILFDHMAYRWMSHRPSLTTGSKIGIAIATTAGVGAKQAVKSIKEQLFWLGFGKLYGLPVTVSAMSFADIEAKRMAKITKRIDQLAAKVKRKKRVKPGIKSRLIFQIMRMQQKGLSWNPLDTDYWKEQHIL